MAYICDDCKYIFPNKRTSCPFCGGRVYNNTLPEQNLLNNGYSLAPNKMTKDKKNQPDTAQANHYNDLRQAFLGSQTSESSNNVIPEVPPKKSDDTTSDNTKTPSGVDYFSQFSENPNEGIDIPTVEPTPQTHHPKDQPQNDPYEQELRELELQRRRLDRQYRQRAALDFITNIRWRTVFRVLFVLLLIVIAVTVWQMRYVILNSIINFLLSLLPIILIVWILWYIFRSFFR